MSYVRQEPKIFTENGIFSYDIEKYLGDTGSDALAIVKKKTFKERIKENSYKIFFKYDPITKYRFCDFTSPSILAQQKTLFLPQGLSKESWKVNKNLNPLAEIVSCIAGFILFGTAYTVLKTIYTIKIANRVQKAIANTKSLVCSVKQDDSYNIHINKQLLKICKLKKLIYSKEKLSNIFGLILKVTIFVSSILLIVGASVACYPLLMTGAVITAAAIIAHVIKSTTVKYQQRKTAAQILKSTEILRVTPPKIEINETESSNQFDDQNQKDSTNTLNYFLDLKVEKEQSPLLASREFETPKD